MERWSEIDVFRSIYYALAATRGDDPDRAAALHRRHHGHVCERCDGPTAEDGICERCER